MDKKSTLDFLVNKETNTITVKKEFAAELSLVWDAFTKSEILDNWWAPKPWKAKTKTMDFREGGHWLYAMVGPAGEEHWSMISYTKIENQKCFTGIDSFCDANGKPNKDLPQSKWKVEFKAKGKTTVVENNIYFEDLKQLETIISMGFKEGYTMTLTALDHYLKTQIQLIKQNKTTNKARVSSYLNFPGNTEEAFNFYKKVFKSEFSGKGIQRFSDFEMPEGAPPMSEENKNLIIHIELPILGGHLLMATDAPESMGFKLITGNNMNIHLEPDSKEETIRLFEELSKGGIVTMELSDMFFGSYFGMCTDKYGINWMFNFTEE